MTADEPIAGRFARTPDMKTKLALSRSARRFSTSHQCANAIFSGTIWAVALVAAVPLVAAAEAGPTLTVAAMDPTASEAGHAAIFLVSREAASIAEPLVVPIALTGTATPGVDYVNPGPTLTFPAQTPMIMVKIVPIPDALPEGNETVMLGLVPKPGVYTLGDDKTATATIADTAPNASHAGKGEHGEPYKPPPPGTPSSGTTPPAFAHSGTLTVELTLNGQGTWRHASNGAYSAMNFQRSMSYTVPLDGIVGGGSGFTEIDRREQKTQSLLPNLQRYLALQPHALMVNEIQPVCGKGEIRISDEYKGMEVGDPGQPPLVPYTETWRGGGAFPSGDKTVPERDLCLTRVTFDDEKHVLHVLIDGSDSHVKTHIVHNGHESPAVNVRLQGEDEVGATKAKLTFFDVPLLKPGRDVHFTRTIEGFSAVVGRGNTRVPMRATVNVRVTAR